MKNSKINFIFKYPILILFCIGFLLYANSLNGEFIFDDKGYIETNKGIRSLADLSGLIETIERPTRVVAQYTFALNYHFHKLDVFGYHLLNVLIHIFVGILIFKTIKLLCSVVREGEDSQNQIFALLSALLFLVHPVQTQAVSYISQRMATLATFFYLLSVFSYLKFRLTSDLTTQKKYFFFCAISAILGMFTKEIVFTLPFALLLIEVIVFQKEDGLRNLFSKYWVFIASLLVIVPALHSFSFAKTVFYSRNSLSYEGDILWAGNYLLTQFSVILFYLKLLFFPIGQNLDYHFKTAESLFSAPVFLGVCVIVALIVFAMRVRKREPLIAFGILWFFLTLSVESSIIPIRHVIFEHRLYLPTFGFCLVFVRLMSLLFREQKNFINGVTIILVILSILTVHRNLVWRSELAMWQDVVLKSPQKARPYYNLGTAQLKKRELAKAFRNFARAIELNSNYFKAYANRGLLFEQSGDLEKALEDYTKSLEIRPSYFSARLNRSALYQRLGKSRLALDDLNNAIAHRPDSYAAYINRGQLYAQLQQFPLAFSDLNKAIDLNPTDDSAYVNRGLANTMRKNFSLAINDFNRALELNPNRTMTYFHRAVAHTWRNNYEQAIEDFSVVLNKDPAFARAYAKRANLYFLQGEKTKALADYAQAINFSPQNGLLHYKRSMIFNHVHDYDAALKDALKAKSLGSDVSEEYVNYLKEKLNG